VNLWSKNKRMFFFFPGFSGEESEAMWVKKVRKRLGRSLDIEEEFRVEAWIRVDGRQHTERDNTYTGEMDRPSHGTQTNKLPPPFSVFPLAVPFRPRRPWWAVPAGPHERGTRKPWTRTVGGRRRRPSGRLRP